MEKRVRVKKLAKTVFITGSSGFIGSNLAKRILTAELDTKVIGLDIVELKGYTSSGVALSACRLIGSIVRNEKSVVPVSAVLSGQYGLTGAAMSLPCVISKNGIDRVLELPLDEQGKSDLQKCYEHLRTAIENVYTEA